MALVSTNGLWLTRANNSNSLVRTDGVIEAMATGALTLSSTGNIVSITSLTSDVILGGAGNPDTVSIGSNMTTFHGDLTMDVLYANDVVVTNKVINLSSGAGSNDATHAVDWSGILLADPNSLYGIDERSIVWRAGLDSNFYGVSLTANGAASNQGCWDVTGGALRITMPVLATSNAYPMNSNGGQQPGFAVGRDVSYGLRVNSYDEIELFKRVLPFSCNNNEAGASYRVVARFGGAAGPNAISLPTSYNKDGY
jgi:hypothetical protein